MKKSWASSRVLWLVLVVFSLLKPAHAGPEDIVFTDVTNVAGVALPDTLNESVAWADYDNDGDEDLYLTNLGPNRLFRNDGDDNFTDVTEATGVGHPAFSVGAAFGDLDNDGDLDLYVVTFQPPPGDPTMDYDALFRNDGPIGADGEYVFTDVAEDAGTTLRRSSRPVTLLDFDHDGLLDVYVMSIGSSILYRNLGDLRFENVASALGVDSNVTGVGIAASDVDGNGWIDIFTGNRSFDVNDLFLNDGRNFTNVASSHGINATGLGMGVLSFDYDNDLDFDLYWTTWPGTESPPQPNALYENRAGNFVDVAEPSGTGDPLGWGISCNAGDIDNDGWEDFFVTNGFSPTTTANVLFRNRGDRTFADLTTVLGGGAFDGRGAAFCDYDRDGDLDLIVTGGSSGEGVSSDTRLWRNDTENGNHWVALELVGSLSNRSAIGTRVEVTTAIRTTVKEVSGGAGRGSQNSLPLEFGLGSSDRIEEIRIRWPSGTRQTIRDVETDRYHRIREPLGVAFNRGDINDNGQTDITDAVFLFGVLFLGRDSLSCLEAANTNDDDDVGLTDGVYLLNHLFLGGPRPPEPGVTGSCGFDPPTAPDLGCEAFTSC